MNRGTTRQINMKMVANRDFSIASLEKV